MSHYQITPDTHQQTALHNGESRCQRRSRFDRRFIRQALNHSHPLWPLLKQNSVPRRRQHRHRFHKTTHGKTQRSWIFFLYGKVVCFNIFFQARSFVGRGKPASLSTGGELCQAKSSEEQVRIPSFSISCEMCRKRVECADTKCVEIFLKLYQMIGKSENGTKDHGLEWLKMADLPILPLSGIVGYPTTQHLAKEDFFILLHHCQWYIGLHHAFGHDNYMTIMIVTIMALVCIYS